MGTIHHHVAVATVGWGSLESAAEAFERVREFAGEASVRGDFGPASPTDFNSLLVGPISGVSNGFSSYLMVPDGSKEWWNTSDVANEIREYFVEQMSPHADVFVGSWGELSGTAESNRGSA